MEEFIAGNVKRGFLGKDFELFHLKDDVDMQVEFHYHDFNKVVFFLSGQVTYIVEGKAYQLKPYDILLVGRDQVHKPVITQGETYERIIIWVDSEFVTSHSYDDCSLLSCFNAARERKTSLLRTDPESSKNMVRLLLQLEEEMKQQSFGGRVIVNSLFLQILVYINRLFLDSEAAGHGKEDILYDENIEAILDFINGNLDSDLSVERLAELFYVNRFYLMHKFKKQTGYSLHQYILQKRLIKAKALMKEGMTSTQASIETGFGDYSNFVRSFKKTFGLPPKKYLKSISGFEYKGLE